MADFQSCDNQELTSEFHKLHTELIDIVIQWCKDHNIKDCDEFILTINKLKDEVNGTWNPGHDSSCMLKEDNRIGREPYLFSI